MNPFLAIIAVGAAGLIVLSSYGDREVTTYATKCETQGGRVVSMPSSFARNWIQCVKGLEIVTIMPEDRR